MTEPQETTENPEILDKQEESKPKRNEKGQLLPGNTANPKGRSKGRTMKEFARDFLMSMTDEDKIRFLNSLSKDVVWRMAEGNPANDTNIDLTSDGKPLGVVFLPMRKKEQLKEDERLETPKSPNNSPTE